jgi:hypothetical protein
LKQLDIVARIVHQLPVVDLDGFNVADDEPELEGGDVAWHDGWAGKGGNAKDVFFKHKAHVPSFKLIKPRTTNVTGC